MPKLAPRSDDVDFQHLGFQDVFVASSVPIAIFSSLVVVEALFFLLQGFGNSKIQNVRNEH